MSRPTARIATLEEIEAEEARRSLGEYVKQAWHVIEPVTPYLHNWHIDCIAEHMEAVVRGEITRLAVNIPPRYMKSILLSVMAPTWAWIDHPHKRFLFFSYSQSLSTKHSWDRRHLLQSKWYRNRWGERFTLAEDQKAKMEFANSERGHMIASSVGGTGIGKGGDIIVVDDPLNPKEALSDVERENTNVEMDQTISTRLDDKKRGAIVLIMQRLHEEDVTGHVLEQEDWAHICLPAEYEPSHPHVFSGDKRKEPGELLWPEREGPEEIAKQKRRMGSYAYAGQYQQHPSPLEGGLLKRVWWRFYVPQGYDVPEPTNVPHGCTPQKCAVLPDELDTQIQSWDMAFKDTKGSSFVVGQVWGSKGADRFLLAQVRDRLDFPATVRSVIALTKRHPEAVAKIVEDKANGPAVISTLKHRVSGLIADSPQGSKEARASAVSPDIEAGNVYLPHPSIAPWVSAFIEECAQFPTGAHDDQVDAMSQALLRLRRRRRAKVRVGGSKRRIYASEQ